MSCARLWFHGCVQGHSQGSKVSVSGLQGHLLHIVTFRVFQVVTFRSVFKKDITYMYYLATVLCHFIKRFCGCLAQILYACCIDGVYVCMCVWGGGAVNG